MNNYHNIDTPITSPWQNFATRCAAFCTSAKRRPAQPASSRNSISSCWPSRAIPDGEEPRIAYLAERLQIQHHSAVELVDRMEKKGLIVRSAPKRPARSSCPADRAR